MKIKVLLIFIFVVKINAQETTVIIPNERDSRVITTGMPFLLITADARAAAMGDMGVATSVDAFSQQWNPSKYAFSETKSGVGVSYTPYLSQLVNDVFLGNLTFFNRIDERSAFAFSLKYFSLGDIEFRENEFVDALIQRPNEFSLDAAYALRLSPEFAMSVAMRFMRSDLKLNGLGSDATAASTFGVDVSGYYQGEEEAYTDFNGCWRLGFAIQNIGPKFSYDEGGVENFQPTNLRLGVGFDFIFDNYNKIAVTAEVAKLLVPTPPRLGTKIVFDDTNDNGTYEEDDGDVLLSKTNNVIYQGQSQDVGFLAGMFQSFNDAPGGFREELKEFSYALGAEYRYQDSFAFRTGYFDESKEKGARNFFALGAGFKANMIHIDLSYLFSASKVQSPLENTLRFSLTFNIGANEFHEF